MEKINCYCYYLLYEIINDNNRDTKIYYSVANILKIETFSESLFIEKINK